MTTPTVEEIVEKFDTFVKKWCVDSVPHLLDSDDNDGEDFRQAILAYGAEREAKGREGGVKAEAARIGRIKIGVEQGIIDKRLEEERERIVEWCETPLNRHESVEVKTIDDVIDYLSPKEAFKCRMECGIEQVHTHPNGDIKKVFFP